MLTMWHWPHAPAAAGSTAIDINISCLLDPQQQTCRSGPMVGQINGRTDGRTLYHCVDPAVNTLQSVLITRK